MQLISHFERAVSEHPDRTAFVQPSGERISYAAAAETVDAIAYSLQAEQPMPGTVIAIYSPNDATAFIAILGVIRAGFIWVSLNARNTVDENIALVKAMEARAIFFHGEFEMEVEQIRASVPTLSLFVCLDRTSKLGSSLSELRLSPVGEPPRLIDDNSRPCTVFATGGTTGRSKGAVWTNQTWETLLANFWSCAPSSSHPVHLCAAPMTHAAGILGLMLLPRAPTNVLVTKADSTLILEAIERYQVTHLFLPPTVLYALLSSPDLKKYDTSSLIFLLISAAPVSGDKLREAVEAFGPVVCQSYGQAEAPFFLTYLSPKDLQLALTSASHAHILGSCGRPTIFSEVEIMDEQGHILSSGKVGEIVARGNLVMTGYYMDAGATAAVSQFGWHHTGDIGWKDEAGYVFIVDRKRDIIISGGFNIFSTEVESALLAHAAVLDCAVIGVPDEKWGEAVKAVVELKSEAVVTPDELVTHCKKILGSVKAPKSVEIWDTLPRSPAGKVLKRSIRESFWANRGRSI